MITMNAPRILIVEDENIVANDIQQQLFKIGYFSTTIVPTGEEAIRISQKMRPDLILMDIRLSNGKIDGVETAEYLKRKFDIPIIFLTAFADSETVNRAHSTEPYGYLVKPVLARDLKNNISVALQKSGMDKKLKDSLKWLYTTLASVRDAVIATDNHGRIKFINRVAENLTQWTKKELGGKALNDIFRTEKETPDPNYPTAAHLLKNGESSSSGMENLILQDKLGMTLPIESRTTPIMDEKGHTLGQVIIFRDLTGRRVFEENMKNFGFRDPITNLPNRQMLYANLKTEYENATAKKKNIGFIVIDIDRFKKINDELGLAGGDQLLKLLGFRLSACVKDTDFVTRLSDNQFVIVLNQILFQSEIIKVINKIWKDLEEPFMIFGKEKIITLSAGVSMFPRDDKDSDNLIGLAEKAMRMVKLTGRNGYRVFGSK